MKAFTVLIPTTQNVVGFADITEENKDLDMIQNIAKDGMKYFFDRFGKIKKEEHPEEYKYFSQYFNMYLFDSDIWEISSDDQFKILGRETLDDTNIRQVLDMVLPENEDQFWENVLHHLDLIKMSCFVELPFVYEH